MTAIPPLRRPAAHFEGARDRAADGAPARQAESPPTAPPPRLEREKRGEKADKGVLYRLKPLAQEGNSCGTTSLAMVMNALRAPVTPAALDAKYRKSRRSFTGVRMMVQAARDYGLFAEIYNGATFGEIRRHLDERRLLIAASLDANTRKYGMSAHYVVIHGYALSAQGEPWVAITDPAGGRQSWRKFSVLEEKWADPRYLGMSVGFNNLLITVSSQDDLPPRRLDGLALAADQAGHAGNLFMNALADLKQGRLKEGVRELGGGLRHGIPALGRFVRHKLGRKPD